MNVKVKANIQVVLELTVDSESSDYRFLQSLGLNNTTLATLGSNLSGEAYGSLLKSPLEIRGISLMVNP